MAELNLDQIGTMEDEFIKLQKIELGFKKKNSALSAFLLSIGVKASIYDDPRKLRDIISKLDAIITGVAKTGRVRGKVMASKTIKNFLAKAERQVLKESVVKRIERIGIGNSKKRLALYKEQIAAENVRLIAEIKVAKQRLLATGAKAPDVSKEMIKMLLDGRGPIVDFQKRVETIERNTLRREASATEIEEYKKIAVGDEDWQWIAISANPCPDCQIRAGAILSYKQWENQGLPGDGETICRESCMCKLLPVSVSDELFPDVKQFKWDKESGVLTGNQSMKLFKKAEA